MGTTTKTLHLGMGLLNPKLANHKQAISCLIPSFSSESTAALSHQTTSGASVHTGRRKLSTCHTPLVAVLSGHQEVDVSSSQFEGFSATGTVVNDGRQLEVSVKVSGTRTRIIFDQVFDKMVAAAQPIPGFRRVKGGKTPNIPRDILLGVLGPSKVYRRVIKQVINSTVAEYVEKENLKVSEDLKVKQSVEDLEDAFEPGGTFYFEAVVQLRTD